MHHNQDIRWMGGVRKYMPITWITSLLGSLALIGTPLFAGFYSKDSIIEAVHDSHLPGAGFAYFAVMAGVFVTAFYSFRMYFLVFHGKERFDQNPDAHHHALLATKSHDAHRPRTSTHKPHESPWVVTVPLVLLAIPSVVIGFLTIEPDAVRRLLQGLDLRQHRAAPGDGGAGQGIPRPGADGAARPDCRCRSGWRWPAWCSAWYMYMVNPALPAAIKRSCSRSTRCWRTSTTWTGSTRTCSPAARALLGVGLWKGGDQAVIDGAMVNGSARGGPGSRASCAGSRPATSTTTRSR